MELAEKNFAKLKIKEVIVVEGKYDKITLSNIVDTLIIQTDGFKIFKDNDLKKLVRTLAERQGILVLTDSDGAGLVIRNHLSGLVPKGQIKHGYIPEILGKEKRKNEPSKAGTLGVEGMARETLIRALKLAGATIVEGRETAKEKMTEELDKAEIALSDLMSLGLAGLSESSKKRDAVLDAMGLPSKISAKRMLDIFNTIMSRDEFFTFVEDLLNY